MTDYAFIVYMLQLIPAIIILMTIIIFILDAKTWKKLDRITTLFMAEKKQIFDKQLAIDMELRELGDRVHQLELRIR
jgi:hypothetical protein